MSFVSGWWPFRVRDWQGVRLYLSHEVPSGDGGSPIVIHHSVDEIEVKSDFYRFFRPVLSMLRSHSWIFGIDSFNVMQMPSAYKKKVQFFKQGLEPCWVSTTVFIEECAPYASNDWNRLFGLPMPVSDWTSFVDQNGTIKDAILDAADVVFDNYDGPYWACYSSNAELNASIIRHNE